MQNPVRREDQPAQTIGQRLARARLEMGASLSDASSATKLKTAYLEAMESDQFDNLPAPYYTRNFIKTYAKYLGLDGGELAEEFGHRVPQAVAAPARKVAAPHSPASSLMRLMRHPILFALGIAAVILLILYLSSSPGKPGGNGKVVKAASPGTPATPVTTDAADVYTPVFTIRDTLPTIE